MNTKIYLWVCALLLLMTAVLAYVDPVISPEQTVADWKAERITLHQAVHQLIRYYQSQQPPRAHLM